MRSLARERSSSRRAPPIAASTPYLSSACFSASVIIPSGAEVRPVLLVGRVDAVELDRDVRGSGPLALCEGRSDVVAELGRPAGIQREVAGGGRAERDADDEMPGAVADRADPEEAFNRV